MTTKCRVNETVMTIISHGSPSSTDTRSIFDRYFNPLVFWYQWDYLRSPAKTISFFVGYLRSALDISTINPLQIPMKSPEVSTWPQHRLHGAGIVLPLHGLHCRGALAELMIWFSKKGWCPSSFGWLISQWKTTGWWFGTFFIFPHSWDDGPIWLIFFKMG